MYSVKLTGCPLPTHRSEKSTESFSVQTAKNIWACQSMSCAVSRNGKKGGNVIDFVSIMENCSVRDAGLKLSNWFISSSSPPPTAGKGIEQVENGKLVSEKRGEAGEAETTNKPLSFTLKDIDPTHPYVRQRGLKEETARHFGVGLFPGRGSMTGKCVIPIHNEGGELIAYAGRAIDGSEPKYKLPAGFKKSDVLFNLHRARLAGVPADSIIVVEGFFDGMKVHQAGFPRVVALMGSSMSEVQEKLLSQFAHIIVLLDGDEAGREGAAGIAARLVHRSFVKVISLSDGKQPDQLSSDEIKALLSF